MEHEVRSFRVMGYDKDGDLYDVMAEHADKDVMITMAKAAIYYHTKVREICRKNGEPYDWFVVGDNFGNILELYTFDQMEGIHLRD